MISKNHSSVWRSRLSTFASSLLLLVVVGLVIATIAWAKLRQFQAAMSAPPPPEMPVSVALFDPQPTQFQSNTVVVGTALAYRSVTLRNEEPGVVTAIAITPGGMVKAGDLLIQTDDRVEQAALNSAKATLKQVKLKYERAEKLKLAKANSAEELDLAFADTQRAQAEVERLIALIDRKRTTAEFDAKVGLFDIHVGQYLDAGTNIATLEGIADYLHVDFSVPAHVADQIQVGDTVRMRAHSSSPFLSATIIALDSRADAQTRSLKVRAKLVSPPDTLLPGDSVLVTIDYGPTVGAVLIPQTAVRRGPTGVSVFLAIESDPAADGSEPSLRARSVPVELAGSDGTMSRIVRGVSLGDRVVTDGSFKVSEGALLGPIDAAGAAATSPLPTITSGASNEIDL